MDRPIKLHSTRIKALAPRGAYFFQIIILYDFHGGSKTIQASYRQDFIQPLSIVIYENCPDWTTTKAYAPYVDVRRDDSIKDVYSPGSYGLKHCILQLDRAALGASFPKMERAMFLGI